jgi:type IV pilus assembly protein PilC
MAQFIYQALNNDKATIEGTVEATDRNAAIESLAKQGLHPLSLKTQDEGMSVGSFINKFIRPKVKTEALVIFTRQLSTMVGAGVPLLRSLNSLREHTEDKALRTALDAIYKDIQGGDSFADALEKHPHVFGDVYVSMVRAGEAAGILDEILGRLAQQQEKSATIKKKVKGAMTYPMILIIITVLAFFGLMLFVIPQIGKILTDLGGPDVELPILTQIMLGISGFMIQFWWLLLIVSVGGTILLRRFLRTPQGKYLLHTTLLKVPVLKGIIIKIAIARFSRTFASLMSAGVSVVEALSVTTGAIGNVAYREQLDKSIKEIKNGKQLSETLQGSPLFPEIVSQMLSVGEETGKTDTVLIKVADFYEEEVDVVLESLNSIIEPVMIVFMGGMVGLIAASVMGPIASIAQNVKS